MLLLTYFSEIFNTRAFLGLFAQVWLLPTIIALRALPDLTSPWAKYAVLTVLLSYPSGASWMNRISLPGELC